MPGLLSFSPPVRPPAPVNVSYEIRAAQAPTHVVTLSVRGSNHARPLQPSPKEIPSCFSPRAIRSGYIAAAVWLVKNERWPDAESRSLFAEQAQTALAA
jgi:hypothetical protein